MCTRCARGGGPFFSWYRGGRGVECGGMENGEWRSLGRMRSVEFESWMLGYGDSFLGVFFIVALENLRLSCSSHTLGMMGMPI